MPESHSILIAGELGINENQVRAAGSLFNKGATIPFIARYRKEATGSLDEVMLAAIRDRLLQLEALDERRQAILKSLEERGLLTDELKTAVSDADSLAVLEDIYLPYRPKRRTRAMIARERGLESLAQQIFAQEIATDPFKSAEAYIDLEKGVEDVEDALAGARDIIAEWINEDKQMRHNMRVLFWREGIIYARLIKGKEKEGVKYSDYFDREESVRKIPGHRMMALLRGEKEEVLGLSVRPPEEKALALLHRRFIKNGSRSAAQVDIAGEDSYKRLLAPSMETDIRHTLKERADDEALKVFARNVRENLMAPPMGQKKVLAIDPGFRTGCKAVCLDRHGGLLFNTTFFIEQSEAAAEKAARTIREMLNRFEIESIAIGNGTAGRETEEFIQGLGLPGNIPVVMVNESGASVYSASAVAREEFPDHDVTVRGAVSIGRRLIDPLAELVKIDPKSIGVGQYQHDVDQSRLKTSLDDVVMGCVNEVGVEINTASRQLLSYVSGLGPALAKSIIEYRNKNGAFRSREEIKSVPRLGPKAFEQAAGFLRIHDAENPLDASAVHPESYHIVRRMADDLGLSSVAGLIGKQDLNQRIDPQAYIEGDTGLPTINDILVELVKPGRDPRQQYEAFSFAREVNRIEQLMPGMKMPGIVTNITNFGAFVDIGVHQDGLVHISQMSDSYVKNPADLVSINQRVQVTVLGVDTSRKRIVLSMKDAPVPES